MQKYKIYDCSNSVERPSHRTDSLCPKENDIMRGLKKYCKDFGFTFTKKPSIADLIITNDVYPKEILTLDIPKVKRMDGVYWQNQFKDRNIPLNRAAQQSNAVIFISEYSMEAYENLYGGKDIKNPTVVLNSVDNNEFFRDKSKKYYDFTWVASASNWAREEKRFDDLMLFISDIMSDDHNVILIGKCDFEVTNNVKKAGYIKDYKKINAILNKCHAFINFSYHDAAPKVVSQAVNCELPILYADSGGVSELVKNGTGILDEASFDFRDEAYCLNSKHMRQGYGSFMDHYSLLTSRAKYDIPSYQRTMSEYFDIFRRTIEE